MLVIPVINEAEFGEVLKKIKIAERFSPWIHFDIADGKFTTHKTWNDPKDLQLTTYNSKLNFEIHLMVENPEAVIKDWVEAGAKRIIIHLEAINIWEFNSHILCEIGLAINPETPVEDLIPYLKDFKFVQILAVNPGPGGQKFQPAVLEKIKFLKKIYPDVMIEVDGGINPENAKLIKEAGADIAAVGSYIFRNIDPKKAFEQLKEV